MATSVSKNIDTAIIDSIAESSAAPAEAPAKKATPVKKAPPQPESDNEENGEDDNADEEDGGAKSAATTPTKQHKKQPPKKPTGSVYLYGPEEEKRHQAYLAKYPEPDPATYDTETKIKAILDEYTETALNGVVPAGWKLVRAPEDTPEAVKQRKEASTAPNMFGPKREKGQTNEDYMARYNGLRGYHFAVYDDDNHRKRWVLSLRHFPGLANESQRKKMDDDPSKELFVEKPASFLERIGEFAARMFNHPTSSLFSQFRGLLPDSLIYHRIKGSLTKQKSAAQKNALVNATGPGAATVGSSPAAVPSLAGAASAAAKVHTVSAMLDLFNQKVSEGLHKEIAEAAKRSAAVASAVQEALKNIPAAPAARAPNAFDAIWKAIYADPAHVDRRRGILEGKIAVVRAEKSEDEGLKMLVDMMNPEGEWKKQFDQLGDIKFVAEVLKTPVGKRMVIPAFLAVESAGASFNERYRKLGESTLESVARERVILEGIEKKYEELKDSATAAGARLAERITALEAANEALRARDASRDEELELAQSALKNTKKRLAEVLAEQDGGDGDGKKRKKSSKDGKKKKDDSSDEESGDDSDSKKKKKKEKKKKGSSSKKHKKSSKKGSDDEGSSSDEEKSSEDEALKSGSKKSSKKAQNGKGSESHSSSAAATATAAKKRPAKSEDEEHVLPKKSKASAAATTAATTASAPTKAPVAAATTAPIEEDFS